MLVPCGTTTICSHCARGEHRFCTSEVDLPVYCIEHKDPLSCKCHCVAHADNKAAVKEKLRGMGFFR